MAAFLPGWRETQDEQSGWGKAAVQRWGLWEGLPRKGEMVATETGDHRPQEGAHSLVSEPRCSPGQKLHPRMDPRGYLSPLQAWQASDRGWGTETLWYELVSTAETRTGISWL